MGFEFDSTVPYRAVLVTVQPHQRPEHEIRAAHPAHVAHVQLQPFDFLLNAQIAPVQLEHLFAQQMQLLAR